MYLMAIEGGATHTCAGLYDEQGKWIASAEGGPANPTAYGVPACVQVISALNRNLLDKQKPGDLRILAGLAGAVDASLQAQLAAAIGAAIQPAQVRVSSDLHALLHANAGTGAGILAIAGTGAAVLAKNEQGRFLRTGGWGVLLGDEGSGYAIAAAALRCCARALDGVAPETTLVDLLPPAAGLSDFNAFVAWSTKASKRDVAALMPVIADAADQGDITACACIEEEARRLAALAIAAQERLHLECGTRLFFHGSVLERCIRYQNAFRAALDMYSEIQFFPCSLQGPAAVLRLDSLTPPPAWCQNWTRIISPSYVKSIPSNTESAGQHPPIDEMSTLELTRLMNQADSETVSAVSRVLDNIALAADAAAECLLAGGRIIYAGAGTSGRLGVLDASECPPTFGVSPGRVVALMAGGDRALRESVEGAEDNAEQGALDVQAVQASTNDFVLGIAASGATPYVKGVLEAARAAGSVTALLTSNPASPLEADHRIVPNTGPEVLPGSTRLKAGTAAKLVLNMISTGAMTRAGYVYKGRMFNMTPVNDKLRARAERIVAEIAQLEQQEAQSFLMQCNYNIAVAIVMAQCGLSPEDAELLLQRHEGRLRDALHEKQSG